MTFIAQTVPSEIPEEKAVFASQDQYADYSTIKINVVFGAADISNGPPNDRDSFRNAFQLIKTIRVPIYDNLRYDPGRKSFRVKLLADPETVSGSPSPIRPIPGLDTYNAYDYVLDETEVFIWDSSTIDYSTCVIGADFFAASTSFTTNQVTVDIPVKCSKCIEENETTGCITWAPIDHLSDDFIVIVTTLSTLPSIVTSTTTGSFDNDGYLLAAASLPAVPVDSFDAKIQVGYKGIITREFLWTSVPSMTQVADVRRLEKTLDSLWEEAQYAPAQSVFEGYLHFACITGTATRPSKIGFAVSQGASVVLSMNGEVVLDKQRAIVDLNASDAGWQAVQDLAGAECDEDGTLGIICYQRVNDLLANVPYQENEIVPISVMFKASPLYPRRPAGVRFAMLNKDDSGAAETWKLVSNGCLYGGVEVVDSPARGLKTVDP